MTQFFVMTPLTVFKIELDPALSNPVSVWTVGSRTTRKTVRKPQMKFLGRTVVIGRDKVRIAASDKVKTGPPWYEIGDVVALCLERREVNSFLSKVDNHPVFSPFNPEVSTLRALAAIGCDHPLISIQLQ